MKNTKIAASCRLLGLALIALTLGACVAGNVAVRQVERLEFAGRDKPRLLVMTPDVKYYLQTASGMLQPQAEWTEAARRHFGEALISYAGHRDMELVTMPENTPLSEEEIAYQKLYSVVGQTILYYHYGQFKLPTKKTAARGKYAFDWSLGDGVRGIAEKYNADYALFSYYRDTQATGGRILFAILAAAATQGQAAAQLGSETGFAALVDLRSGDIVWFNHVTHGRGELRNPGGADTVVSQLLRDLPGS